MIIDATDRTVWLNKLKSRWNGFGDSKIIFQNTMESALAILEYLDKKHIKNIEIRPCINGEIFFEFFLNNFFINLITHDNNLYTIIVEVKPNWKDLRIVNDPETSTIIREEKKSFYEICKAINRFKGIV